MRWLASLATAAVVLAGIAPWPVAANPIAELPGQWSGWGAITLAGGASEKVKCIAVYKVSSGGAQVRQSLRCASTTYNINAVADLTIRNGRVSGTWEEKSYSATGAVTGKVAGNSFSLSIDGGAFTAAMNVATNGCKQSISIVPQGIEIANIAIGLGKC